jgi:hypothetical protein
VKQNLIVFLIIVGVLFFVAGTYWFLKPNYSYTDELRILKTWKLPESLKEVSGISHIDDSKLACIQDEKGSIYIYDLNLESLVKEIQFGPRGDYEAIRIIDSTAYVMDSSGQLFRIENFELESRLVEVFQTEFSKKHDIESFDINKTTGEILTIPKENNLLTTRDRFLIYELDPTTFNIKEDYFINLSYRDPIFEVDASWFMETSFFPSELTIHPTTQEVYILDSKTPRILILEPDGSPKKMHLLNPEKFQQPEGLSFDSKGRIYISNEEGDFQKQNIQLIEFK